MYVDVNGDELFLLGRKLMKVAEDALARAGYTQVPTSVRSVLVDILEHPDSGVGEVAARTGFPQSHVSASVARLRALGALETVTDPEDRRRTLVRASSQARSRVAKGIAAPIDEDLAAAFDGDARTRRAVTSALETLAKHITRRDARRGSSRR